MRGENGKEVGGGSGDVINVLTPAAAPWTRGQGVPAKSGGLQRFQVGAVEIFLQSGNPPIAHGHVHAKRHAESFTTGDESAVHDVLLDVTAIEKVARDDLVSEILQLLVQPAPGVQLFFTVWSTPSMLCQMRASGA